MSAFKNRIDFLITLVITVSFLISCGGDDSGSDPLPDLVADAGADQNICVGQPVQLGGSPSGVGGNNITYSWSGGVAAEANPEVSPPQTTTYVLTITDENGREATDEITITVEDCLVADAGEDQTICSGASVTLGGDPTASGTSNYSYLWTNGAGIIANPEVTPSQTTTYEVTVIDEFGATATDEVTITVIEDTFTIDAGSDVATCEGDDVILGANPVVTGPGTYSYSWSDGFGEISTDENPTVNPTTPTTYTVTVTDASGCFSKTDNITISILQPTSGTMTFNYTGSEQTFTFPECVTSLNFEIHGAQGQDGFDIDNLGVAGQGGKGAVITGTIQYNPSKGETISIYVGGSGANGGFNGGGLGGMSINNNGGNGGGATDIRYGGVDLAYRIVVAGGGGGGGGSAIGSTTFPAGNGGSAGSLMPDGTSPSNYPSPDLEPVGGSAGTETMVGHGGLTASSGGCLLGDTGEDGVGSIGGNGGDGLSNPPGCTIQGAGGGAGGGGFFGGGAGASGQTNATGASFSAAGGGAGSSYTGRVSNATVEESNQTGNGVVIISWGTAN